MLAEFSSANPISKLQTPTTSHKTNTSQWLCLKKRKPKSPKNLLEKKQPNKNTVQTTLPSSAFYLLEPKPHTSLPQLSAHFSRSTFLPAQTFAQIADRGETGETDDFRRRRPTTTFGSRAMAPSSGFGHGLLTTLVNGYGFGVNLHCLKDQRSNPKSKRKALVGRRFRLSRQSRFLKRWRVF